jgi:hypothetical protein
MFRENQRLVYCEPVPLENNRLDSRSIRKKPVRILRKFLNIVKIEANNRNRYSKNRFSKNRFSKNRLIMGTVKLINLPERWFHLYPVCFQLLFSLPVLFCFMKLIHHMKDNRPACCLTSLFAPFNTLCGTTQLYHTCPVSVSQESKLYSILWQKILLEGPSGRDSFHTWDWGTPCYHTSVFRLASPTLETGDLAFCKMLTNSLD